MNKNKGFNKQIQTNKQKADKNEKNSSKIESGLKKKLQKVLVNSQAKTSNATPSVLQRNKSENPKPSAQMADAKTVTDKKSVANTKIVNNKKMTNGPNTFQKSNESTKVHLTNGAINRVDPAQSTSNKQKKNRNQQQHFNKKPSLNKNVKNWTKTSGSEKVGDKRKISHVEQPAKKVKVSGDFIETDINDEEQLKEVESMLTKTKEKLLAGKKMCDLKSVPTPKPIATEERVIVHGISDEKGSDVSEVSDSDNDDYINKFFGKDFNKSESFNENKTYSFDEIENHMSNGFFHEDSETESSNTSESSVSDTDSEASSSIDKTKPKNKENSSPNTKVVPYTKSDSNASDQADSNYDEDNYDFDDFFESDSHGEYVSSNSDDDEEYYDVEEDDDDEDDSEFDSSSDEDAEEFDTDTDYEYDSHQEESASSHSSSSCNHEDYNELSDSDYANSEADDVRIATGTAKTHKITDPRIKIFKNGEKAKIIELPITDSEDESCVDLVSIHTTREEILSLHEHRKKQKEAEETRRKREQECLDLIHQRKCEAYYKKSTKEPMDDYQSTNVPVTITCLANSSVLYPLEEILSNSPTEDELDINISNQNANRATITSVSLEIPQPMEVEADLNESVEAKVNGEGDGEESEGEAEDVLENTSLTPKRYSLDFVTPQDEWSTMSRSEIARMKPKFFNSINSRDVLLLLRSKIHFHGNLNVRLIAGNAQAFGYKLKPNETVTVHSPRGHCLVYIEPSNAASKKIDISEKLKEFQPDFLAQDLEYLSKEFNNQQDALILMKRETDHKGVNMIERYMKETMFPNINAFNVESPFYSSEFILHCQFSFKPRKGLFISPRWSTIPLTSQTKLITIGGKGVGKSTFIRYTINANLDKFDRFLCIDLDIGQPELFVPQTISATLVTEPILGPGYLKSFKPAKSILFGDINVLPSPIKYLRCVQELLKFCKSNPEFENIPWIVNTMGYSRGFGLELMMCILKILQPTDLVQIQSPNYSDNFEMFITAEAVNTFGFDIFEPEMSAIAENCNFVIHKLFAVKNATGRRQNRSDLLPKDIRYAMILSKLGNILKTNADWLTTVKPYEASLSNLEIVLTSGDVVKCENYPELLNANLVYLCQRSKQSGVEDLLECSGIGIIRAVDAIAKKVYLLSSVPLTDLHNVNTLAICAIPLHSSVLLNQHSAVNGYVPYVYNTDNFIGSKQVAQHIFRPEKNRRTNVA